MSTAVRGCSQLGGGLEAGDQASALKVYWKTSRTDKATTWKKSKKNKHEEEKSLE
jgi:hypothetical protein